MTTRRTYAAIEANRQAILTTTTKLAVYIREGFTPEELAKFKEAAMTENRQPLEEEDQPEKPDETEEELEDAEGDDAVPEEK